MTTELKNRMMIKLKGQIMIKLKKDVGAHLEALWSIRRHKWGKCAVPCSPFEKINVKLSFLGWWSCILNLNLQNCKENEQNDE